MLYANHFPRISHSCDVRLVNMSFQLQLRLVIGAVGHRKQVAIPPDTFTQPAQPVATLHSVPLLPLLGVAVPCDDNPLGRPEVELISWECEITSSNLKYCLIK